MRSKEFTEAEVMPSVKTLDPMQIALKHNVSIRDIETQLDKGTQAEMEHTTDVNTAREIALDHLAEMPDYYDRLERMERGE